jgi:hypothetical protein
MPTKCSLKIQKKEPLGIPSRRIFVINMDLRKIGSDTMGNPNLFRTESNGGVLCTSSLGSMKLEIGLTS